MIFNAFNTVSANKTVSAKFSAVILVSLFLSNPASAQGIPRNLGPNGQIFLEPSAPNAQVSGGQAGPITLGTYVLGPDGQFVFVPNPQAFDPNAQVSGGQPGSITGTSQPLAIVPRVNGVAFQPPPVFTVSPFNGTIIQPGGNSNFAVAVVGSNRPQELLQGDQDRAIAEAIMACSAGTQAECETALRVLGFATRVLYPDVPPAVFSNNLLSSFRQVVAGVRARGGAPSNIAEIDDVFAGLDPQKIATRPSSPA